MFKKLILIASLSLTIFSIAHADILSESEKNFNEQVMNIMKDIEDKSISQEKIDGYLNNANVPADIKQAVKSNVMHHKKYSDFHKAREGIYFCKKANNQTADRQDEKCVALDLAGHYGCVYKPGSTCHITSGFNCMP